MSEEAPKYNRRNAQALKSERVQISLSPLDDRRLAELCKRLELSPQAVMRFLIRQAYEVLGDTTPEGNSLQLRLFPPSQPDGKTPIVIPIPKTPPKA